LLSKVRERILAKKEKKRFMKIKPQKKNKDNGAPWAFPMNAARRKKGKNEIRKNLLKLFKKYI